MKKIVLTLLITFAIVSITYGQVTVGSGIEPTSGALLDIKEHEPDSNNVTAKGGLLLPRVLITEKTDLNNAINTTVSDTNKSSLAGLHVYNVGNEDISAGPKIWNGSAWIGFLNDDFEISASNGLTTLDNNIKLGGKLLSPTVISATELGNNLEFNSSIAGSNLLVTGNAKLGIGTSAPQQTVDIDGTFRLGSGISDNMENRPRSVDNTYRPLVVSTNSGQVVYAPIAATRSVGGFRPGANFLITTVTPQNTILRVSFVCYVNQSNETNHSDQSSYTYGDFTIIGSGSTSPMKFVEVNIRGYDGQPKTLTTNTSTVLEWANKDNQKFRIVLDQTTGNVSVKNELVTLSYMFQLLGGM